MGERDTASIQNTIVRAHTEMFLGVDIPSKKVKKLYTRVLHKFIDLMDALDSLNDAIEEEEGK